MECLCDLSEVTMLGPDLHSQVHLSIMTLLASMEVRRTLPGHMRLISLW